MDRDELPNELVLALNRGEWKRAADFAESLLTKGQGHASVHYAAGVAYFELKRLPKALAHFHVAVGLAPQRADLLAVYARALASVRMTAEALAAADRCMALQPREAATLDILGMAYTLTNAHAKAVNAFRSATEIAPDDAHNRYNLATSLMFIGELGEAEAQLNACLRLQPSFWRAYPTRSQLRAQTPEQNHISEMEQLLGTHADEPGVAELLNLALAKEYEDIGRHAVAFSHLVVGKRSIRARVGYTLAADAELFDALVKHAPPADPSRAGINERSPIFVMGLPRSGTTLVERILSSHPDVHSAGELQQFGMALKRASGSSSPRLLDLDTVRRAQSLDWAKLGAAYLQSTQAVAGSRPHFVDKLPHNFLYAAYIAKALPQASIICLRRNPMDTCLSNFRQSFGESSPFHGYALDLLDTGRYYLMFDRLLAHWRQLLPGRILELQYEDLLDHQEERTRALLAHCGLSWNEACLHFETNEAPVATASAVQVRSPLYRSSVGRWKRYGHALDDLRALFADAGIAIDS